MPPTWSMSRREMNGREKPYIDNRKIHVFSKPAKDILNKYYMFLVLGRFPGPKIPKKKKMFITIFSQFFSCSSIIHFMCSSREFVDALPCWFLPDNDSSVCPPDILTFEGSFSCLAKPQIFSFKFSNSSFEFLHWAHTSDLLQEVSGRPHWIRTLGTLQEFTLPHQALADTPNPSLSLLLRILGLCQLVCHYLMVKWNGDSQNHVVGQFSKTVHLCALNMLPLTKETTQIITWVVSQPFQHLSPDLFHIANPVSPRYHLALWLVLTLLPSFWMIPRILIPHLT